MFRQRIWQGTSSSQIPNHNTTDLLWQVNVDAAAAFYLLAAWAQPPGILRVVMGGLTRPTHAAWLLFTNGKANYPGTGGESMDA